MDETVMRYKHCGRDVYRFCRRTDDVSRCPICAEPLTFCVLEAPVTLTCPFRNAHHVPWAFVMGSVRGPSDLGEWNDTEIHVGVSNSKGLVYNYTSSGVRRDDRGWEQCVCVQLVPPWRQDMQELWDTQLEEFSSLPEWVSERFFEERPFGSCCYGFALTFINRMRSLDGKAPLSRNEFTGSYVLPRMKPVSTYINIYHTILQHGYYIADEPENA